jgi:hypothetical protein
MRLKEIKTLTKRWSIAPSTDMYERTLRDTLEAQKNSARQSLTRYRPSMWRILVASRAGALTVGCLTISLTVACLVLYRDTADLKHDLAQARQEITAARQVIPQAEPDKTTTISLYLREHRDVVARYASLTQAAKQPAQLYVSPRDVMYYEFLDEQEYMNPGIIVRGPSSEREIDSSKIPAISYGHTLTLSEAQQLSDFELRAPARLFPGFCLDQIRRIHGQEALQLLYTNGIDSISLFEQSLDGQRGLEAKDFREYAVYRQSEQAGGTILAWRDDEVSYILIGNIEMSQLMDMAQSISASN